MAASFIKIVKENWRKEFTGDTRYAKVGRFAFVLHGPPGEGPLDELFGTAVFPLVVNPDSFEYSMPFAADIQALQEGGVNADEQGIVIGEITMSGTMGFKVRDNPGEQSAGRGDGEFTGGVDAGHFLLEGTGDLFGGASGHLHFWRLATRCFDGYSALKKDPRTSARTRMEFHDTKDDLHFTVIPKSFVVSKSTKDRIVNRYQIRLAVVGPASSSIHLPSPDVGLLQGFKNTIAKIRNAIQSISAAVDDITAAIDDIRRTITGIAGILDDVAGILDSFSDLVDGVKKFADIPKAFLNATANLVASAAHLAATTLSFPADVAQSLREIEDGLDQLAVGARKHYREALDTITRKYDRLSRGDQTGKDPARDAIASDIQIAAVSGKGRLSVQAAFGSGMRAGDVQRGQRDPVNVTARFRAGKYKGFEERVVSQGDTIQSLAAKHLGDAREAPAIAAANQLKAPYITDGPRLPGTLQIGSRIIIPLPTVAGSTNTLTTGEKTLGDSQADAQLGVDFEMVKLANGTYGWSIDTAGGATDVRAVSGIANLAQGVGMRFRTERGQNILYPSIGLPRIGGRGLSDSFSRLQFEARRQLLADTRVKSVTKFRFVVEQDVVDLEASIVPIGYTSDRVISRTLT